MSDLKDILRRKEARDKTAYQRGFEEGGFAGMGAAILIFGFIVFFVVPYLR
jgi:energy-converting hydrogenase Eha subunit G